MSAREYDPNGFFEIKGNPLSKAGIFEYVGSEIDAPEPQKIYKILRPEEELASPETIKSFKNIPLVNEHTMLGKMGTPAEKKGVHGVIGEQVYYEDGQLRGNLTVFSDSMSNLIDSGKNELSLGYACKYDFTPGVFNGEYYDAVQRDLRGNHVALVEHGRMGKEVAVLDGITSDNFTFDSQEFVMKNGPKSPADEQAKKPSGDEDMPKKDDEREGGDEEVSGGSEMTMAQVSEAMSAMIPMMKQMMEMMGGMAKQEGDMEAQEDEKDEYKDGMDSLTKELEATKAELSELKKVQSAMDEKSIIASIARRNELAGKVSKIVGSFDHSSMTLNEVAEYGVEKMGIPCEKGGEVAALDAALHVMAKNDNTFTLKTAQDGGGQAEVADIMDGGSK